MSKFEKYFTKEFAHLKEKDIQIEPLLKSEMLLISGDFYGIQKFIFERLNTKNASKVIRAKSAFIQLFTVALAQYICQKLNIDEKYILTTNAGKFEILSPNMESNVVEKVQELVNDYFIKKFYGLSGVSICYTPCKKEDFLEKTKYKQLREKIANIVEEKKFKKLNLKNQNAILSYNNNIANQTLCKICNIRKIEHDEKCDICSMFVKLGKDLVSNKEYVWSKKDLLIDLENFDTKIMLNAKIKSYILKGEHDDPIDFEHLAKNSCKDLDTGVQALGILKADVDGMGKFIKNSDITDSFENFDLFSKTLDNFFSIYIPSKMKENFSDTYTVFAGGDDLFLVGSWDVILELARFIHDEFSKFVVSKELTISFGIAIANPSTPISYLAEHTEHLLEASKAIDDKKDAISLFRETVKWKTYLSTFNTLNLVFKDIKTEDTKTAFLYRLLDLCDMSKLVKQDPINNMWKSKLVYSFVRNMDKKYTNILHPLNEMIEKYPQETKMFLSEFIYKRRD